MKELDSFTVEQLNNFIESDHAQCGDVAALAAIALAAKKAEPVTWWTGPEPTLTGEVESFHDHETGSHYLPLVVSLSAYNTTPQLNSPEIPEGWIKCSDHKPERGTDVQVYCSDTREQFVAFHLGNGEFQYAHHEDTSITCRPSHWMPLSAAPEKENG
ncbi:DUF551 domain-containing protein [Yersinia proxima]|uniref:DUF551 domain-containing protein n=1 Tax=Yersinia proxima TaxID=2890316 RepID=UPI003D6865C3